MNANSAWNTFVAKAIYQSCTDNIHQRQRRSPPQKRAERPGSPLCAPGRLILAALERDVYELLLRALAAKHISVNRNGLNTSASWCRTNDLAECSGSAGTNAGELSC